MRRLIARPPRLTLNTSFAEAYRSGRFTQLELFSAAELIREADQHGLAVRQETLEELDRYGAFAPVAFAGADWRGDLFGPRWNVDAMTFRDEAGFQRWGRYAFREDGVRRVIALYSPWQLMYLKSALEDRIVTATLPFILGRRDRLLQGIKNARPLWRVHHELWQSLEQNWRPLVLLLCWMQNRYLPFVRGSAQMVYAKDSPQLVNPVYEEVRTFDARAVVARLGGSESKRSEGRTASSRSSASGMTRSRTGSWSFARRRRPRTPSSKVTRAWRSSSTTPLRCSAACCTT